MHTDTTPIDMRHDYELPGDWHAKSDEEKDRWFKQERARRQHINQHTPTSKELSHKTTRYHRKRKAAGWQMTKHNR